VENAHKPSGRIEKCPAKIVSTQLSLHPIGKSRPLKEHVIAPTRTSILLLPNVSVNFVCYPCVSTHRQASSLSVEDEARLTLTAKGRYLLIAMVRQFFVSVNSVRDQARESLPYLFRSWI